MNDLISRQAAIDAILAVTGNSSVRELYEHVQEHGLSDMWSGGVNAAIDIIIAVPPIHPEPCEDTISRKAAIDALEKVAELYPWRVPGDRDSYSQYNEAWQDALNRADSEIEALPSAQTEIIRCKDCKHQVKEWRTDKRLKDNGYMVCGCDVVGDACGTDTRC